MTLSYASDATMYSSLPRYANSILPRSIDTKTAMRLLLAIFLPFLAFFTIGRPIAGIICLLLQITLIGWLPAALWAVYALSQYKTDKKIKAALGK